MIVVRVTLLTGKRKTRLDTEFCLIFVLCLIFAFFFEERQPLLPRLDSEIGRCANRWGNAWAPVPDALAIA